jgi:hypothetical protein
MSVGSVGGVESQPSTTSVEQGAAAGRRLSRRNRHRLNPASVTPGAIFGSRMPARPPPGSQSRAAFGRSGREATGERAASAASDTEAAGASQRGAGRVASVTRPPRTEMCEREKVSPRAHRAPRCHRSPGSPGASAPGVESREQRAARVGERPRPRAGQGRSQPGRLGVRGAIPRDSTSVEELEPRVGRPARAVRGPVYAGQRGRQGNLLSSKRRRSEG